MPLSPGRDVFTDGFAPVARLVSDEVREFRRRHHAIRRAAGHECLDVRHFQWLHRLGFQNLACCDRAIDACCAYSCHVQSPALQSARFRRLSSKEERPQQLRGIQRVVVTAILSWMAATVVSHAGALQI